MNVRVNPNKKKSSLEGLAKALSEPTVTITQPQRDQTPASKYSPVSVQEQYARDFLNSMISNEQVQALVPEAKNIKDLYNLVTIDYLLNGMDEAKKTEVFKALNIRAGINSKLNFAAEIYSRGVPEESLSAAQKELSDSIQSEYIKRQRESRLEPFNRASYVRDIVSDVSRRRTMFPKIAQAVIIAAMIIYGAYTGYNLYKDLSSGQQSFIQYISQNYNINVGP
jgi:hypothetical protein